MPVLDSALFKTFLGSGGAFLLLYLLRGFGLLTFLPGSVILILISICLISGLGWGIKKTIRF